VVLFILNVPLSAETTFYDPPNPIRRPTCRHTAPHQEVALATLKQIVRMLERQRRELLDQLDGIDRAIAALGGAAIEAEEARPAVPDVPAGDTAGTVRPRHVKPRRVLSDAHKQALIAGKRKAREAHDVAKGLAREMPGDGFVPAIGTRGDRQAPRLIKGPIKK
jgi:hypothetical protein